MCLIRNRDPIIIVLKSPCAILSTPQGTDIKEPALERISRAGCRGLYVRKGSEVPVFEILEVSITLLRRGLSPETEHDAGEVS